jgi:hypothetical protein
VIAAAALLAVLVWTHRQLPQRPVRQTGTSYARRLIAAALDDRTHPWLVQHTTHTHEAWAGIDPLQLRTAARLAAATVADARLTQLISATHLRLRHPPGTQPRQPHIIGRPPCWSAPSGRQPQHVRDHPH